MRRIFVGVSQSTVMLNATPALQAPGDEHEVLVLAAGLVRGLRGDDVDRRLAQPADEVEVVRREVLDDADVRDAVGERAAALGADQEDLADLALLGAPAQLDQRRVEALDVPDGGAHARLARTAAMICSRLGDACRRAASRSACARRPRRASARPRGARRSAPRRSRSPGCPRSSSSSIEP